MKTKVAVDLRVQDKRYRLAKVWQDADFSLYCKFEIERLPGATDAVAHLKDSNEWSDRPETERKLSYHTTGRVNYHALLPIRPRYFQPLSDVDRANPVFAISITDFGRLNAVGETDQSLVIDCGDRTAIALGFTVMPYGTKGSPLEGGIWGRIDYDHFGFVVHEMPKEFSTHGNDIHVFAPPGLLGGQSLGKQEAELAYVQKGCDGEVIILGPDGTGAYVMYPTVVMARTADLTIRFRKDRYTVIPDERSSPHKVIFRINGPNGRVRQTDLRDLISEVFLNARLPEPKR